MLSTVKNITPVGEHQLLRTIIDPTSKEVDGHLQDPVGMVLCPHCHQETNVDAFGIFHTIGNPHPLARWHVVNNVLIRAQVTLCNLCSGYYSVGKRGDKLSVYPQQVPQSILDAEQILARQKRECEKLGKTFTVSPGFCEAAV
jgi:hypothetical protein